MQFDFNKEDVRNENIYSKFYQEHGDNYKTLNWGSEESQQLRFKILSEVGHLHGQSILDVGCGFADYYRYLSDNKIQVNYSGLDITKPIVEEAQKKFPGITFFNSPLNTIDKALIFDYVFASGIYTYRSEDATEFLQMMTLLMYQHCRKGIAFNSLSSWSPSMDDGEFYADPLETLFFCRTLSPGVVLRHDYHARDFTIYIYKERNI